MENCTIIKVKRKITEDPVDCLIIECKKKKLIETVATAGAHKEANSAPKLAASDEESIKEILKYAGSASNEEEISAKLIEINSKDVRKSTKPPILKQTKSKTEAAKPAAESEQVAKTHKYVLTNKKRGFENSSLVETNGHEVKSPVKDGSDASSAKSKEETVPPVPAVRKKVRKNSTFLDHVNIIDVIPSDYLSNDEKESQKSAENQITCNDVVLIREKVSVDSLGSKKETAKPVLDTAANEYVYDIYYTKNSNINLDLLYANNYEITPVMNKDQLIILDENGDEDEEENYEDDEDSNDEQNWRNDYPDEEENDSYDDDDDGDYGDDYDEYGRDYDDEGDRKLSNYLKKSCTLDRSYYDDEDSEKDDYDEYDEREAAGATMSYSAYKKKLLRELEQDYHAHH